MAQLRECRVVVADDHPLMGTGLVSFLQPHCHQVGLVTSLPALWLRLHDVAPDVVVLDVSFGTDSSLTALPAMHSMFPSVRFVILTAHGSALRASALMAGASDYLSKTAEPHEVLEALQRVVRGDHTPPFTPAVVRPAAAPPRSGEPEMALTPRQTAVLTQLLEGHTQSAVAGQLGISRRTVEYHLDEVRRRTGIRRMPLLLAWFRERLEAGP